LGAKPASGGLEGWATHDHLIFRRTIDPQGCNGVSHASAEASGR
jgi:hypothetical protein